MMKRNKHVAVIALVSVLLASFLVLGACQKRANLKGMEIIIGNWWADYDVNTRKANNEQEEKQLEQRKKFLQEYGVTIREKSIADWGGMQQQAITSTMSGKPDASVFLLQPDWAMAMKASGLLAPLPDSIKKPFSVGKNPVTGKDSLPVEFNQPVINSFTFDGKIYGFGIGINYNNFSALFFNKRLFREAGLDPNLPYDMQKDGTWTWDAFLDICKKLTRDTDNDGKMDTYAMTHDLSTEILNGFVASNGAAYVDKDPQTGKFVNATNRPEFLEALQFVIRLKTEGVLKLPPEGANWDWYKSEFVDGKVAMRIEDSYIGMSDNSELSKMKDDWGMVLLPKGPKSPNQYHVFIHNNMWVVPATYKPEDVEKIIWGVALWQTPVDNNWKAGQYSYFRDARAVDETSAYVHDEKNHIIKYHMYISGLNIGDIAWQMWWHEGDPAQLIEAVSQNWNDKIAAANK